MPRLEQWIEAAMRVFAEVNGGATRLPTAQGIWSPGAGEEPMREASNVVYSFIRDEAVFAANVRRLAAFIHSFGKHARQSEVMVEFAGKDPVRGYVSRAYFVDKYPLAGPRPF